MSTLLAAYHDKVERGDLRTDVAQAMIAGRLDQLSCELEAREQRGFLAKRFGGNGRPKGIYIHGEVGRGKTMLMDLFFSSLGVEAKARVHFQGFMQDIHRRRQALKTGDVISEIAGQLAPAMQVLCLDEMQVNDIADATIIGRLFEALMARGTVILTTSNVPPDGLYRDGLNRNLFLPAIKMLNEKLDVVSLDSPTDYRLGRVKAWESFVTPLGPKADAHIQRIWEQLAEVAKGAPLDLPILGRSLRVPQAARGCARFRFAELCEAPLGPPDFLALAAAFKVIFIEEIPALKTSQRNEAKRFVLLIDALYDTRVRLVASSAMPPEKIYPRGDHRFEFARTVSRLQEMQSAAWWGQKIVET
jgi:cell division protein ZapE